MNSSRPLLKRLLIFSALTLTFGIGLALGWGLKGYMTEPKAVEYRGGEYGFINPLLECEGSEDLISRELSPFKDKVEELIQQEIEAKRINFASVYFRDLNNGPWIGINEREPFLPGSLLKVPLMLGYFNKAESDPSVLSKKIAHDKDISISGQFIRPAVRLERGKEYTVEELIYRMIVYSDNEATYLLQLHDRENLYGQTYVDLGIPVPDGLHEYRINVKKYASFFRILFNASYLNKEMSNKALELLSKADFAEGIMAGIPPVILTAQKFGESKSPDNQKQFHDCGIVYYPKHPYLLCIMTKGNDYRGLPAAIKDISRLTFEEVDRQMRSK